MKVRNGFNQWIILLALGVSFATMGCDPGQQSDAFVEYEADEAGEFGEEFSTKLGALNLWSSDSCCIPSPTDAASCNQPGCVSCVAQYDPYCENGSWDELCVFRAADPSFCMDSCHCERLCIQGSGGVWLPGDLNGTDDWANVLDAQCEILMALWEAQGSNMGAMPSCMAKDWWMGDLNCNGSINVGDVLVLVNTALQIDLSDAVDADGDWCPDNCDYPGPNPCEQGASSCDDGNRCSAGDVCVAPACDGLKNQEKVSLEYVIRDGSNYKVGYSKAFSACAHMKDLSGTQLHSNNYFCTQGSCKEAVVPASQVQIGSGDRVRLCHGNNGNICSNFVVVSDGPKVCRGTELNCDDSNYCTSDYCDPHGDTTGFGGCYQVDISNTCPDQYYCTDDGCDPNRSAGNTYTSGSTGCFSNKNNGKCEDTNYCTQNVCTANSGSDGNGCTYPDESWRCNDGLPCTNDWCDSGSGSGWSGVTANNGNRPPTAVSNLWPQGCKNVYKCSAVPNGTDSCSNTSNSNTWGLSGSANTGSTVAAGTCHISGCNGGYFDFDGSYANGCECKQDNYDFNNNGGNACSNARWMGSFNDNAGTKKTRTGNLLTKTGGGDEDWYRFNAIDVADTTCDNFSVRVRFTKNTGGYVFDIYRTGLNGNACTGVKDCTGKTDYERQMDFKSTSGGKVLGECPCTNDSASTNMCQDNSGTFAVRVYRPSGVQVNCASYTLEVSNGVY